MDIANYFFNKQEQERVLKLWKPPGDAKGGRTGTPGRGVDCFVGKLQSGKEVRFHIADSEVELKAPAGDSNWTLGPKFADAFQPGSNNGLLPAMFLYRLMAVDGPKGFTEPITGHASLAAAGRIVRCGRCPLSRRRELVLLRPARPAGRHGDLSGRACRSLGSAFLEVS